MRVCMCVSTHVCANIQNNDQPLPKRLLCLKINQSLLHFITLPQILPVRGIFGLTSIFSNSDMKVWKENFYPGNFGPFKCTWHFPPSDGETMSELAVATGTVIPFFWACLPSPCLLTGILFAHCLPQLLPLFWLWTLVFTFLLATRF